MDGPLLRVADIAAMFKSSVASVYRLVESGKLPHYKVPGAGLRFEPNEIKKWLAGKRIGKSK